MWGNRGCVKWGLGIVTGLILFLGTLIVFNGVENRDLNDDARNEASGTFVQLKQGMVHYYLEGPNDAPLVVFIHGFSVPSYVWEPTTTFLNNNGYRTLRFDLFGRGYSDRPDLVYDISLYEEQLTGLIDILQINAPVTVVGLSMGGPIAARFAHQNPDRVNGVVLISPEVTKPTMGDIFPLNVPVLGEYLMAAVMEPYILPRLQANDFTQPENFPDWEAKYRVQLQFKSTGKALLSSIRELAKVDPELEYHQLQETVMPVILFWGTSDQTIGRNQIEVLKQILPKMEVRIIEGAGHLMNFERSEEVNLELIDFLDRIAK